MKQMSHYGSLQCVPARLILPSSWNVWEFLILWREEERVILGLVWLFINLPFPFFWEGVVIFLPLAHTDWEQRYKDSEQSFFIVVHFKNQLLFWGNLTGSLDFTEVDVFPIKALGILWNLFVMHVEVLLLFNFSLLYTNWISKLWLVFWTEGQFKTIRDVSVHFRKHCEYL